MPVLSVLKAILQGETGDFAMDMKQAAETAKEFGKEAKSAGTGAKDMSSGVGQVEKAFTNLLTGGALLAAGYKIAEFAKASVIAAEDAARASAQLDAVIKSTGGAAGVTSDAAEDLASNLSKLVGIDDDLIVKNEAIMLTFTKIGRDVFPTAMQAALDMSAAMGGDLQSSVMQLGKALNDPILGVGALRRVGVQLTDSQEAMVKQMVEAGDVMGAQKIILGELATEFGGAAEAIYDAGTGAEGLKNSLGNLQEAWGAGMLEPLRNTNSLLVPFLESWAKNIEVTSQVNAAYRKNQITLEEQRNVLQMVRDGTWDEARALEWLAEQTGAADEATGEMLESRQADIQAMRDAKKAAEDLAGAQGTLNGLTDEQKDIYDEAAKALGDFNVGEATRLALEKEIALLTGKITEEEQQRAEAIGYLTQQLSLGNLTQAEYLQALEDLASSGRTAREVVKAVGMAIDALPDSHNIAINVRYRQNGSAPIGAEPGPAAPLAPGTPGNPNYGGMQAGGGDLRAGHWYNVGEQGPEPFFPAVNGLLLSNREAREALAGAGGSVVVNVGGVQLMGPVTPAEAYQAGLSVGEGVRAALRAQGRA